MSILIKGMEMPRNCESCTVAHLADCELWMIAGYRQIHKDCPLVEVPTPHGRLIDEKQIPYTDLNADMPQSKVRVWATFKDRIDRVPTIIEAEE